MQYKINEEKHSLYTLLIKLCPNIKSDRGVTSMGDWHLNRSYILLL